MESIFDFSTFPWSCFYLTNAFVPDVGEQVMSNIDALVTFLFGVCLPTLDVYSDMGLAYRFLTTRCHTFKPYLYYEKYHQWNRVVYKDWKEPECPIWYLDEGKFGLEYNETCTKSGFKCPTINKTIAINNICDGFLYIPSYGAGINGNDCGDWSDEKFCHEIDIFNETICTEIEGKWGTHTNFAIAMICPVLLSMVFLLPQWWIFEKETSIRNRIWTFLLVLILFWPQWKMLQILYMGLFKKDPDWKKEKEKIIRNVGCLEPVLESLPQVHIILCLWGQNPQLISGRNISERSLFIATFASSVFSASKGLGDFLLHGPCKLLPNDGFFGGMGKMGYIFLLNNIAFTLCAKGISLGLERINMSVIHWACFNILPQFIMVCGILVLSLGLKKTISTILKFPAIVFLSTFTCWTIGPTSKTSSCGFCKAFNCRSHKLSVSFGLTWANAFLTMSIGIIGMNMKVPLQSGLSSALLFWLLFSIGIIFLILIQFLDGCLCGCSPGWCASCCKSKCLPVKKLTFLDVKDMDSKLAKEDIETVPSKISYFYILLLIFGFIWIVFGSVVLERPLIEIVVLGILTIGCGIIGLVQSNKPSKCLFIAYSVLNICLLICCIIISSSASIAKFPMLIIIIILAILPLTHEKSPCQNMLFSNSSNQKDIEMNSMEQ